MTVQNTASYAAVFYRLSYMEKLHIQKNTVVHHFNIGSPVNERGVFEYFVTFGYWILRGSLLLS